MSRRGDCLDNAAMESWERFDSPADAKAKLFDCIEVFYDQARLHASLDDMAPAEFERTARKLQPAACRSGIGPVAAIARSRQVV
jgi:transposase InsO family protein